MIKTARPTRLFARFASRHCYSAGAVKVARRISKLASENGELRDNKRAGCACSGRGLGNGADHRRGSITLMNLKAETVATGVMDDPRDTLLTGIERAGPVPHPSYSAVCCAPDGPAGETKSARGIDIRIDERSVASADASHLTD